VKLNERITRWRESREGLTKAELARSVGVSSAAVAQWESGDTEPTHDNVEAIAKAIGVSLSVFWGEPPARPRKAS
jgi:transcriptional regulator with XRE-family HTH domain